MKIFVYFIGKPRDPALNAGQNEFLKRIGRFAQIEMREIQPGRFDPWAKHSSAAKILLDPEGKTFDSPAFARIFQKAENEGRDQVFVLGGAEGFPAGWRERADLLLSLSALTMPHELARLVLIEQIYRAFTILRGHPYPK